MVLSTAIFANTTKSTNINIILNKITASKLRLHLETKFNKLLLGNIEDVYATFSKALDPNEPIGNYLQKQNKCITLLADSDESIIKAKRHAPY